jgi:hypothetical protein
MCRSSVVGVSRIWDLRGARIAFAVVYTLAMAKLVRVQLRGVDQTLSIKADKVELHQPMAGEPKTLKLSLEGTPIGEFKDSVVDGWWIEE